MGAVKKSEVFEFTSNIHDLVNEVYEACMDGTTREKLHLIEEIKVKLNQLI